MRMKALSSVMAGVIVATLGIATTVLALGQSSSTCSSGYVCVSGDWHTPGSTTQTMTHGYRVYNESSLYFGSRYYSNSGGEVYQNGVSVRNRDLNHYDACYYYWFEGAWNFYVKNTYAYVGWSNLGSPGYVEYYSRC